MILYFSATGNCKYVAARLAEAERIVHEAAREKELLQEVPMVRVRCLVKGKESGGFVLETLVEDGL